MTKPIGRDTIYRCRRFSAETIELCVRWYITYRLSYRDLAAMMAERDVIVSHTTIMPEKKRRKATPTRAPQSRGTVQPNRMTQNRRYSCVSGDKAISIYSSA
jgi:transposase-like protein